MPSFYLLVLLDLAAGAVIHNAAHEHHLVPRENFLSDTEWNQIVQKGQSLLAYCDASLQNGKSFQSPFVSKDCDYFQPNGYDPTLDWKVPGLYDGLDRAYNSLGIDKTDDSIVWYYQNDPFKSGATKQSNPVCTVERFSVNNLS